MCGICAIIGQSNVAPYLVEALKHLVYRGYDSCGMYVHDQGNLGTDGLRKNVGEVSEVAKREKFDELKGNIGIAHTRWATHGVVSKNNSHPFFSNSRKFVCVHNGIFSNYMEVKKELLAKGYGFESDTDSEVFVNLVEEIDLTLKKSRRVLQGGLGQDGRYVCSDRILNRFPRRVVCG